jgi:hypothetical protein
MAQVCLYSSDGIRQATVSTSRARMQRLAKHWHYVLRSRRRWIRDSKLRQIIEQRAINHLKAIGVGDKELSGLAKGGLVEVSINYSASLTNGKTDSCRENIYYPSPHAVSATTIRS